jgi:protein-disulfide isomerase
MTPANDLIDTLEIHVRLHPFLAWLASFSVACVASACLCGSAVAQTAPSPETRKVVATVAGEPIYADEISASAQLQLERLRQEEYKLKKQAIEALMSQKVLAAEAKKQGASVEKLLESEVDAKVPEPTPDELTAYYKDHQSQLGKPFEDIKMMLGPALKSMKVQQARQAYARDLLSRAEGNNDAVLVLRPPTVRVSIDPARVRGNPNAPVTIVEFSDFSCPYCQKAELALTEVLAKYPGKVKLAYRDYPLRAAHPNAQSAAEASRCAADQGKFWEFHDLLFLNPDKQDRTALLDDAHSLELDGKKFESCLSSGQYKPQIEQDLQDGMKAGVRGTPAFFVNGVLLDGVQTPEALERIIKEELSP